MMQFIFILAFILSLQTALASRQSSVLNAIAKQGHTTFIRPDQDTIRIETGEKESRAFVRQCVGNDSMDRKQKRFTRKQPQHKKTNNNDPPAVGERKVKVAPASAAVRTENPIIRCGEYMPLYTGY